LVLTLVVGACGSDGSNADPAAELHGEWRTDPGSVISYLEDGSWNAVYAPWGSEPFEWGTYTFDGDTLTMLTTGGGRVCQEGQKGIYEATFVDEESLRVSIVEEPCGARREIATSPMVRQSP
jgi:hypothetical protein